MINVKNIYKSFSNLNVLNGVSTEIMKGEKVVIIGPSGSGKSTLSKKISQELNIIIASTDEVRKQNVGIKEELVWPLAYEMCANELKNGKDVIFDATSITPKVRARLINNIKERRKKQNEKNYFINRSFKHDCYFNLFGNNCKLCYKC